MTVIWVKILYLLYQSIATKFPVLYAIAFCFKWVVLGMIRKLDIMSIILLKVCLLICAIIS
jgi:hypothetical protein